MDVLHTDVTPLRESLLAVLPTHFPLELIDVVSHYARRLQLIVIGCSQASRFIDCVWLLDPFTPNTGIPLPLPSKQYRRRPALKYEWDCMAVYDDRSIMVCGALPYQDVLPSCHMATLSLPSCQWSLDATWSDVQRLQYNRFGAAMVYVPGSGMHVIGGDRAHRLLTRNSHGNSGKQSSLSDGAMNSPSSPTTPIYGGSAHEQWDGTAWHVLPSSLLTRTRCTAVYYNHSIWLLGGSITDSCEYYDLHRQQWSSLPAMNSKRAGAAAVVAHHTVYIMGGTRDNGTPLSSVEKWDPATRQWHMLPWSLPLAMGECSAQVMLNHLVVISTECCWVRDFATIDITRAAWQFFTLPQPLRQLASVVV